MFLAITGAQAPPALAARAWRAGAWEGASAYLGALRGTEVVPRPTPISLPCSSFPILSLTSPHYTDIYDVPYKLPKLYGNGINPYNLCNINSSQLIMVIVVCSCLPNYMTNQIMWL